MRSVGVAPVTAQPQDDPLIAQLEKSITDTLKNKKTNARDRNAAIANGIKLAMIKNKLTGDDEESFFGGVK